MQPHHLLLSDFFWNSINLNTSPRPGDEREIMSFLVHVVSLVTALSATLANATRSLAPWGRCHPLG